MASAAAKAMMLALLGICAISLQGCGEDANDNSQTYKTQAESAGAGAKESAVMLQTKAGCPPLLAAYLLWETDVLDKVIPEILLDDSCNVSTTNLTSADCQKDISMHVADNVIYYVEKDPGFKTWTESPSNKAAWGKVKTGAINIQLQESFLPGVIALTGFAKAELEFITGMSNWWGTPEFSDWLKTQVDQLITQTLGVFCPSPEVAVADAEAKDATSAQAQKDLEDNEDAAKEVAARNEQAAEGIDNDGFSTTVLAGSTAAPITTLAPATTSALSTATEYPLSSTDTTTVEGNPNPATGRRLIEAISV